MPNLDEFGSIPAIEILRNVIEFRGIYDRDDFQFKAIDSTSFIVVAAPPGGGRNPISTRFSRHFSLFNVASNQEQSAHSIFGQILKGFFKSYFFKQEISECSVNLIKATINVQLAF